MGAFAASPEAKPLTEEVGSCRLLMDFAAELSEIVFELIPRKVSIDAAEARAIIEENRAFYAFMKRAYRLPQADACLRVLGGTTRASPRTRH